MFEARRINLMRMNDLNAFLISAFFHSFLLLLFVIFGTHNPKAPNRVSLEIVTLQSLNPRAANSALALRKNRNPKPEQRVEAREHSVSPTVSGKIVTGEVQNPQSNSGIGESEIDSGFIGRVPANAAEAYLADLREQIARQQIYPSPSKAFREEGTVKIRLTVHRSGSIVQAELIEPSPYKRLNDAAISAATRAAPFKVFPPDVDYANWKITLPVRFSLARN